MVVRLTPARRATSSSATRRKPCRSNSTSAASRIVAGAALGPRSDAGIACLRITVVAQTHRQSVPRPIDRLRAPARREPLVDLLLAIAPRQAEKGTRPRRHATGRQEGGDQIEAGGDQPP